MCAIRDLIRDLQAMQVGMEVKDGQPMLLTPPLAEAMVRNNLDAIRANRDEIVRLWSEVAQELPDPKQCKECSAWVFRPEEARGSSWSFCESRFCPYRADRWETDPKSEAGWAAKLAEARRAKFMAENPSAADVPD